MTPQEAVNRGLGRPADCDITIVILWSRLGSPLRTDVFRKPDGEPYGSGTEWEYEDARAAGREVLVYRRTAKVSVDNKAPDLEERREQKRRVRSSSTASATRTARSTPPPPPTWRPPI